MTRCARIAIAIVFAALTSVSGVHGDQGEQPRSSKDRPWRLGDGVTLTIDEVTATGPGFLELVVTVANHGDTSMKLEYRSFALIDSKGEQYPALLPSELGRGVAPDQATPFRSDLFVKGQVSSSILYFHTPPLDAGPVELRVDLLARDDQIASRTSIPLSW